MSVQSDRERNYLEEILGEIGVWAGDVEEHFYKDGEEITPPKDDEPGVTQTTLYYDEDGVLKYEITSNGDKTIVKEYDDDKEVVEKFELSIEDLEQILGIAG